MSVISGGANRRIGGPHVPVPLLTYNLRSSAYSLPKRRRWRGASFVFPETRRAAGRKSARCPQVSASLPNRTNAETPFTLCRAHTRAWNRRSIRQYSGRPALPCSFGVCGMPVRIPSAEVCHLSCIWFETRKDNVDAVRKDICVAAKKRPGMPGFSLLLTDASRRGRCLLA